MINLRNVVFDYPLQGGTFRALDGVNLRIERGDFVAIIGASGSGKTTLMNVIGLMATPTSGDMEIDGVSAGTLDADALAAARNQKLGFIFQHFNLLPRLTVLENVLLPAQYIEDGKPVPSGHWEERALTLLKTFGLEGQEDKTPALLSGGQKQRVAICRALLLDPDVLLADEPTGALDSANTSRVLDLLEAMNREGRTIIVITHDVQVASRAKRVVKIHDGQIREDTRKPETASETSQNPALLCEEAEPKHSGSAIKSSGQGTVGAVLASLFTLTAVRQAFSNLGVIAWQRGNEAVAEECFLAAASRDRMLLEPHVWLARLYRRQKKFAAAERALVEALRRAPDDQDLETALRDVRAEQAAAAAVGKP